jgi:hypothetical protein
METGCSKNPTLAGVLSGMMPGLGQFYCRQWGKGAGFLVGMLVADAGTGVTHTVLDVLQSGHLPQDLTMFLVGSLLVLAIAVWSIIDAIRTAKKLA